MCDPVTAVVAGSAIVGGALSARQGAKNRKLARETQAANEAQASQQAQRAEEQFNRMNQKMPGIAQLFDQNRKAAGKGLGSTFLTGTKGVTNTPLGGSASLLGG